MPGHRRVLFCTLGAEPGPVGGAERQAMLQARELVKRGYAVEIVCPRAHGTRTHCVDGVLVRRLPSVDRRPFRTLTYLPVLFVWLLRYLRSYDLVHVHLANLQVDVVGLTSRLVGVPMYAKLAAGGPRGEISRLRALAWLTRYVGIRSAHRLQAISAEIEADLIGLEIPRYRIVRIPNGLAADTYYPPTPAERAALRRHLGLPVDEVLVLFAGRFARYKGILDLIEAWRGLDHRREASLILVGEAAADAPVGDLPVAPRMIVRPWASNVVDYLRACDVFVLPSYAEGMSNALLEAMGCGMAVIATRVGAAPEMIDDGRTGHLIDAGEVDDLRSALGALVIDENVRAQLGAAAAKQVAARYAIGPVVDRIIEAYESMLMEVD